MMEDRMRPEMRCAGRKDVAVMCRPLLSLSIGEWATSLERVNTVTSRVIAGAQKV